METLSDKEIVLLQYLLKQSATSALQESTQAKYDALHAKLGRIKSFQQNAHLTGDGLCAECGSPKWCHSVIGHDFIAPHPQVA